jgi:glycosyltransferase involved in cell wall biosynthesis
VNDCSTQKEYYEYKWNEHGIIIIHLEKNSKEIFGFACPGGYQRNFGIDIASGNFIAFCDDDDIWFPSKIELQINAMKRTGCKMSSTDGLFGYGVYDSNKSYKKFNAEYCLQYLKNIYGNIINNGFPEIWNRDFMAINNSMICSSVVIEKEVIDLTGKFIIARTAEDYEYWLRALKHTNSVYVQDICFYYDGGHGYGQNY